MQGYYDAKTLIDVRTPGEYALGHIEGAINIPLDQLERRIDEVKKLPSPLIAYCRSGNRSGMAVDILKRKGLREVYDGGGINDMQKSFSL